MTETINSLAEMSALLRGHCVSKKLMALQQIYQQQNLPDKRHRALHPKLADLLYERYQGSNDGTERHWCCGILLNSSNPHQLQIAREMMQHSQQRNLLLLAAQTLSHASVQQRIDWLSPLLHPQYSKLQQRLAANLLSDCTEQLEPALALNVALRSDHALALPPLNPQNLSLWVTQLCGHYRLNVRHILLKRQPQGLKVLLQHWRNLPEELLAWVIQQASKARLKDASKRLAEIIAESRQPRLRCQALQAIAKFPAATLEQALLENLYRHEDPKLCAAALQLGEQVLEATIWLDPHQDEEIRLAMLTRLQRLKQQQSVVEVAELLSDPSRKIRAAASQTLIALAPESEPLLQQKLQHPQAETRIAAARALMALGKEQWLLSCLEANATTDGSVSQ